MDLHYPPTTFLAEDNHTPIGLNPDVARLVAKKLGLKLKFVDTKFDTIVPGLDGGRFDFTATTMSKTEERLKVLDMIDYFKAGNSVAAAAGNPLNLTVETLCGKNIAVTQGSTGQLKRLPALSEQTCTSKGQPAINGVTLPNVQEALTQLHSKRIDGILYDTTALGWAQKQQPDSFTILGRGQRRQQRRDRHRPEEGLAADPGPADSASSPSLKPRSTRSPWRPGAWSPGPSPTPN